MVVLTYYNLEPYRGGVNTVTKGGKHRNTFFTHIYAEIFVCIKSVYKGVYKCVYIGFLLIYAEILISSKKVLPKRVVNDVTQHFLYTLLCVC